MMSTVVSKRYDAAAAKVDREKPYSVEEASATLKGKPAGKFDIGRAVREAKAGKVEFRVDKAGNIHTPIGKRSFTAEQLTANALALIEAIVRAKPAAAKGTYLRTLSVSSTMSPGVPIDAQQVANLFKKATG